MNGWTNDQLLKRWKAQYDHRQAEEQSKHCKSVKWLRDQAKGMPEAITDEYIKEWENAHK